MTQLLSIPHRPKPGMCPVNGIRDLVQWRYGQDWSNEFLWGLGQGNGFAYLRFNNADPPRQVYTGTATPRQHKYLAELFNAGFSESENRSFETSWSKARQALDEEKPPVLGPLDMYYLHFYQGIYHNRHIPIHYVILAGYDDENAYIYDTGHDEVQTVLLYELQLAWDVNVPGLGKRNRLAWFDLPERLPPVADLIKKSIADECQTMLHPPVSMLGIPAMRKVAREISSWPLEFGEETAAKCLLHAREYLNSPPDAEGDHLTAGRDIYITFLEEAGRLAGLDLCEAITYLNQSIGIIPGLAEAIQRNELDRAAHYFDQIADAETKAYTSLTKAIT